MKCFYIYVWVLCWKVFSPAHFPEYDQILRSPSKTELFSIPLICIYVYTYLFPIDQIFLWEIYFNPISKYLPKTKRKKQCTKANKWLWSSTMSTVRVDTNNPKEGNSNTNFLFNVTSLHQPPDNNNKTFFFFFLLHGHSETIGSDKNSR